MGYGSRSTSFDHEQVCKQAQDRFYWITFDVTSFLPSGWVDDIKQVAEQNVSRRLLTPPHSTSRESADVVDLPVLGVRGPAVWQELPWVIDLYKGLFRDLGQLCTREMLTTTDNRHYAVVLNVQRRSGARYECHVDTNPLEGLLYVTTHPPGDGGELVVSNNIDAKSVQDVDADCTVLHPRSGHLVFFDGRFHPHYVRALTGSEWRIAVAMNYYTAGVPESTRPPDLSEYLYGTSA